MAIKWRKNKYLKPDIVLKKLQTSATINGDKVSFNSFDLFENEVVIATMLEFDDSVTSQQKAFFVGRALRACAKKDFSANSFIEEINELYRVSLATREIEFHLLTTISVAPPFLFPKINIDNCEVKFSDSSHSKEHSKNRKILFKERYIKDGDEKEWCHVTVVTRAKSPETAAEACLNALNILRAFLCLQLNSNITINFGSGETKPINKILLGKYHTVHTESGDLATQTYWYEPNYIKPTVYKIKPSDKPILIKNIRWLLKKTESLQFKKILKKALLRYVNAFDRTDHHSTIIEAWASLESLASNENESNNDMISKRCSFLFRDPFFHRQVIEHIREYRNSNVHYGEANHDPTTICYQLQRYFRHLVYFYLRNSHYFANRNEANVFLDLPSDANNLRSRIKLIKKALNFIKETPKTKSKDSN